MCDVLAISAGYNYTPQKYLPIFAEKGKENMNGWGIGFFREDQALVERSSEQVFSNQQVHESFQRLARVIDSRIIISHVNCPKSGGRHGGESLPHMLHFLDHTWLFVQIGAIKEIETYRTVKGPRLEIEVFTARIFEYLRDQLISLTEQNPYISLYMALRLGIEKLLSDYPGRYIFFLANESVLFAFCNFRQFLILKESERMGDILLITSLKQGLSPNNWLSIKPEKNSKGKLVVIAGPDLLYVDDV
ncbi:MAG: class II glutamine amidotransferase [Pseudomonadota bacterium]|jgi:hypothetical protein